MTDSDDVQRLRDELEGLNEHELLERAVEDLRWGSMKQELRERRWELVEEISRYFGSSRHDCAMEALIDFCMSVELEQRA